MPIIHNPDISALEADYTAFKAENVYITPTGNADTDTALISSVLNSKVSVKFSSNVNGAFQINQAITVNPIVGDDSGLRGRIIDFNNCKIEVVQKSGVTPDNAIVFTAGSFPSNMRNSFIGNVILDGTVNKSFLKFEGNTVYNCRVENIFSTTDAIALAMVEFNSNVSGANTGLNIVKNIYPQTHVKYGVQFTVESGADGQFDDFLIEHISSVYADGTDGACIKLDDNAKIVYSKIGVLYFGGKGHAIRGATNTYLIDCVIDNIYMEPKSATSIALYTSMVRTQARNIHMKFDTAVTTFARMVYGSVQNCKFSNFIQTINNGTQVNGLYVEEIGSCYGNIYEGIGHGLASTYIKLVATSATDKIVNYYGDPFTYFQSGVLKTYSDGAAHSNDELLAIPAIEITDNAGLLIKVKGSTTASANNRFSLKLIGTGIDITLLNFAVDTAGPFELDLHILKRSVTQFIHITQGRISGTLSQAYGGTPELTALTIPSDLKLVANVTNCAYIGIWEISCMRAKAVTKPV